MVERQTRYLMERYQNQVAAQRDAEQFGVDSTPSYLIGRTGGQLQILQVQNPSDPNLFAQSIDRLLRQQE